MKEKPPQHRRRSIAKKKTVSKKKGTRKVNKSATIKDYLAENPEAAPADVAVALKLKGIEVTPTYVSNIKSTSKAKRKKKASTSKKTSSKSTSSAEDFAQAGQLMYQAVELVMKAGAREARAMVDMASKMVEKITADDKK